MKNEFYCEDLNKNLCLYYLNRHLKKKPIERYHRTIDNSALHFREKYKKKAEILLLNAFMHHFPDVQFENLTCESPDFIAKKNGKKIGIELTELINHLDMKKFETAMNKIFRQVEINLEKQNATKFRGVYFLEFHNTVPYETPEEMNALMNDIIKSITRKKPYGVVKKIRINAHRRNVFITFDYNMNLFDCLCSGKILELIQKKNHKYPFYDSSVDECWLVIVSDMNSLASRYTFIQNQEFLDEVKSPFHKIFHLENLCGNMISIK